MIDPFFQVWFAVRYLHLAAVALLAGGALIIAAGCFVPAAGGETDPWRSASLYESIFWLLIGLVAVTGVSNLGLKGDGLLGPSTSWGRALTAKLGAVIGLLALSFLRTDFVIRCGDAGPGAVPVRARAVAGWLYAATVAVLLGAMWIGLGLAHGRY
jgi:hypothetical protein